MTIPLFIMLFICIIGFLFSLIIGSYWWAKENDVINLVGSVAAWFILSCIMFMIFQAGMQHVINGGGIPIKMKPKSDVIITAKPKEE